MNATVTPWLRSWSKAIDLDWERQKLRIWKHVLISSPSRIALRLYRSAGGPQADEWPAIGINDAIADPARMLLRELQAVYSVVVPAHISHP